MKSTDAQVVLERAITKAIDGGWKGIEGITDAKPYMGNLLPVLVFNHDFCKAIFGTNEVCFNCGLEGKHDPYCAEQTFYDEVWKYRLREMVLEDDPIEYLGNNL